MRNSIVPKVSFVILLSMFAGCFVSAVAVAQIQNPLQAAKDAYNKAKADAEAKKQQQQQQQRKAAAPPANPTSQPQPQGSSASPSSGDCCSPAALSKQAAAAGFVDVLGVKLGATLDQAVAAIKAENPKLVIDVHDSNFVMPGKQTQPVHRGLIAHTPRARNPASFYGTDGSVESAGVLLAFPPGPQVVQMVTRYVGFANNAPVAKNILVEALRKKYGPETSMEDRYIAWVFDGSGKAISPTSPALLCAGRTQFNRLDIRDGGTSGQVGAPWDEANEITTALGNSNEYSSESAKCLQYTIVRAELEWNSAPGGPVQAFWVTASSPAIAHNGMAATNAAITGEIDRQIQQQKDDASRRGAPKL